MLVEHGASGRRRSLVIGGGIALLALGVWTSVVRHDSSDPTTPAAETSPTTTTMPPTETSPTTTTAPTAAPRPTIEAQDAPEPDVAGWQEVALPEAVSGRHVAAVWTDTELVLWGGEDLPQTRQAIDGSGAAFDPVTGTWRTLPPPPAPAETGVAAAWAVSEVILCCVDDRSTPVAYDPDANRWRRLPELPAEFRSGEHVAAAWTGTELLVVTPGGVAALDPSNERWRTFDEPPSALGTVNRVVWTGAEVVVWPAPPSRTTAVGMVLDPVTGRWSQLPEPPVLPAIPDLVVVGTDLVLWGGLPAASSAAPSERAVGARFDLETRRWHELPEPLPEPMGCECNLGSHTLLVDGEEVLVSTGFLGTGLDPERPLLYRLEPEIGRWTTLGHSPATPVSTALQLGSRPAFLTADHLVVRSWPPIAVAAHDTMIWRGDGLEIEHPADWNRTSEDLTSGGLSFRYAISTAPLTPGGGGGCGHLPIAAIEAMGADDVFVHLEERGPVGSVSSYDERPTDFGALLSGVDRNDGAWGCLGADARERLATVTWSSFEDGGRAFYVLAAFGADATAERRSAMIASLNSLLVDAAE